jgi:hypothetical protein
LPVQALDSCGDREASCERSCAELSGSAARGENGANGNVFDELGIDARALDEGLEGAVEEVGALGVLEATRATLCDGSSEGAGDDYLRMQSVNFSSKGDLPSSARC